MATSAKAAPALVAMGVSGSGKTTLANALAARLGFEMIEGDSLHPPENVKKMRAGVPLDDADRAPWLDLIGELLRARGAEGRPVIVTCSALKRAYRDRLRAARPDLVLVYLDGSRALIAARVGARRHEYMPASLLDSQFATLEPPVSDEAAVFIDAALDPQAQVQAALEQLATGARTQT